MARDSAPPNANNSEKPKAEVLGGVVVQDLTPRIRRQLRATPELGGALVTEVDSGSNFYEAGLRTYDVIIEINHQPVANAADAERLGKAAKADQILLKIWRQTGDGGATRFFSVKNSKPTK